MPTRNVSLTREIDQFVTTKVKTGLYANASEVMRTALRNLEQDEREYEARLAALRASIAEGDACDLADDVNSDELRTHMDGYMDELAAKEEALRCQATV
jgi:antitoxin ParD1/3/4